MDEILLNVEQIVCVTHLYNKFRKKYSDKLLKEIVCLKSTYPHTWKREIKRMRVVNKEASKNMLKTPPRFWSKSFFMTHNKCDFILNNIFEAFNIVILEPMSKPSVGDQDIYHGKSEK